MVFQLLIFKTTILTLHMSKGMGDSWFDKNLCIIDKFMFMFMFMFLP